MAVHGQYMYTLGGFSEFDRVRRYDAANDVWSTLPALPGGRHHGAGFALGNSMFLVGGAPAGGGDSGSPAFEFNFATQGWQSFGGFSAIYGSHAAVLHGRAYVGDMHGTLQEFDPNTRQVRTISPPADAARDHAQVVAFHGEIWVLGGRDPTKRTVAIYNPASQSWRAGPSMNHVRSGFGAAVVGDRLFVAGGEVLNFNNAYIEPTLEAFTAGSAQWQVLGGMPVAVHGNTAAAYDGRFYVFGGAREAATANNPNSRVFSYDPGD